MSVIVMGMEMPEVCITEGGWHHSCPMDRVRCAQRFAPEGYTFVQLYEDRKGKLPDWCPLRPLPEKHGRLIDVNCLKETLDYYIREAGWDEKTNRVLSWVKDEFIESEHVIVESEGA